MKSNLYSPSAANETGVFVGYWEMSFRTALCSAQLPNRMEQCVIAVPEWGGRFKLSVYGSVVDPKIFLNLYIFTALFWLVGNQT
jgi:hypothetical protein